MPDFLLELFSEEIPARMQAKAIDDLRTRFTDGIRARSVSHGVVTGFVTPRRMVIHARDLGTRGSDVTDERRGPRVDAPEQAIDGFARSIGVARDTLEERDTPKGRFLYATIVAPGRPTAIILAELIPEIVRGFDWPKSMRWGAASISAASPRWVRPLAGVVALLADAIVPFEVAGLQSGRITRGHRFMAPGEIEITSAASYVDQLRAAKVMVDVDERRQVIGNGACVAAAAVGLALIEDDGLVTENAGLTEWPVPLLGHFNPAFLDLPREIIQLTMRTNQKYFAATDGEGQLAPVFVCVANLDAPDHGAGILDGNRKVLTARLSDAKFFWDADRAMTLEARLPRLANVIFHGKLGTVADKVERIAKLARWLVEIGAVGGADPDFVEQAARLCKADLVSATVGEFPEVQGIAGGYLALAEGFDVQVADAIRDHYKPVGPSEAIPTAPVTMAVALADKLDTLVGFFGINEEPTGSRDPFALRRTALSFLAIAVRSGLRIPILASAEFAYSLQSDTWPKSVGGSQVHDADERTDSVLERQKTLKFSILAFLADRLKVQQREAGVRHDLIDAVFALGEEDDLVRLLARVHALQAFLNWPDGVNLLSGYKRASNILRIEEAKGEVFTRAVDPTLLVEPAERALAAMLDKVVPAVAAAVEAEDFTAAMAQLAAIRPEVDSFFDTVTVNANNDTLRENRLNLLARLRAAVHSVADFSKIKG